MAEAYLALSSEDRMEALRQAAANSGRPAYLLEKDIWVVWTLSALFNSPLGEHISFKGGTSLSKVYGIIDRFSEDIDLTIDVRHFIPDLAGDSDGIPESRAKSRKWTDAVRERLPVWIADTLKPLLQEALVKESIDYIDLRPDQERLFFDYRPLGLENAQYYVKPAVMLEFGARSTGEPTELHRVTCDAASHLEGMDFPIAEARIMKAERTFWEKATAAHVYCLQRNLKKERFARHWHDLSALAKSGFFGSAIRDHVIADMVAQHKSFFFREKAQDGSEISYEDAVRGNLKIVPDGDAYATLDEDYQKMIDAGLFHNSEIESFEVLMRDCKNMQDNVNRAMRRIP